MPIRRRAASSALAVTGPLAALVAVGLVAACERDPRDVEVPAAPASGTGRVVVEGDSPALERRGAVITVLTDVAPSAPAATREQAAVVRLTLTSGPSSEHLEIPLGGAGILSLAETADDGALLIELLGPQRRTVGYNHLDLESLPGSVSLLALDVAADAPRRACRACTSPEPLSELRGLNATHVFWSLGSRVATGADDEVLYVATRVDASAVERRALFESARLEVGDARLDDERGLVWSRATPTGGETPVGAALSLARRPMVTALVLGDANRWPELWPP